MDYVGVICDACATRTRESGGGGYIHAIEPPVLEAAVNAAVQRRLAADTAYRFADTPEEQAAREEQITEQELARLTAREERLAMQRGELEIPADAEPIARGMFEPLRPGERRIGGNVYYSAAWLDTEFVLRDQAGEPVAAIEPRSAIEALRLEPLAEFLAHSHRCEECGEPIAELTPGQPVIWSGVPHDALLCAYYRDLKAADADEAEAELEATRRRMRRSQGWVS